MQIEETPLKDLKVIHLDVFHDPRGFFIERYHREKLLNLGICTEFIQDNHSKSLPRVLRGLHRQENPFQAKLVGCLQGAIFDVAVDLRSDSETFMKYFCLTLSDVNGKLLWIPEGFAHGFCVLGEEPAHIVYKVNAPYNPKGEKGIRWDDKDLNIPWPYQNPILSEKDQNLPSFKQSENILSFS